MVTRKALLIANPGQQGYSDYSEGVNRDIQNYASFLRSPSGGDWQERSIEILHKPSLSQVRAGIQRLKQCNYSELIFCGQGPHASGGKSTLVDINNHEAIDLTELREGSPKHTVILDCWRGIEAPVLTGDLESEIAEASKLHNAAECSQYYDAYLERCSAGTVVMYSCSVNERSGEDETLGGYYSFSLLKRAQEWIKGGQAQSPRRYSILTVSSAHDDAAMAVRALSEGRQTPRIEKPRTGNYFPFAVVA